MVTPENGTCMSRASGFFHCLDQPLSELVHTHTQELLSNKRESARLEYALLSRIQQQYFVGILSLNWVPHCDSWLKKQQQNKELTSLSKPKGEIWTDPSHTSSVTQAACRLPLWFPVPLSIRRPETPFPFQEENETSLFSLG